MEDVEDEDEDEDEDEEAEANYTKLQLCMKDPQAQKLIVDEIMRRGGLAKTGSAPASPGEREVRRLIKKMR